MISNISDFETANKVIIKRIAEDDKNFYSLDKYTYNALVEDRISFLRDFLDLQSETGNLIPYDEFVRRYVDTCLELPDLVSYNFNGFSIPREEEDQYVVYPFSRVNLYKNVFPDVLPSLFLSYFNLMKNMKRLHQIGSGLGKAFVISVIPFTAKELSGLKVLQYKDTVELMMLVGDQIARQNTDIEYLLERIDKITAEKEILLAEISRLNQMIINTSITTWR
jgi:hypothetical protein